MSVASEYKPLNETPGHPLASVQRVHYLHRLITGRRIARHAWAALFALGFTPWSVEAAGPPVSPVGDMVGEVAVRFVRYRSDLEYPAANIDTTVEWIGISWRQALGLRVQGTLFGGSAALTQSNSSVTAGARLRGFHAGFALHINLWNRERAQLFLSSDYILQDVDDDIAGADVSLEWHQLQLELGASTSLGAAVCLYGGLNYGIIDGQQRLSGTVNETIDFDRGPVSGAFVGLEGNVEENGFIGIELHSGLSRYAEIFFKHRF